MKLAAIILIATFMQVSAATFGQQLTLNQKKVTIDEVFRQIRKQTGYDVLLIGSKINTENTIDAKFNQAPLKEVLDNILSGKELSYTIDDKTIVIREKEPTIFDKIKSILSQITVTGKITDEKNQPLPGATVQVKGKSNVTIADKDGVFNLSNIDENAVLIISVVGYEKVEIPVNGKTTINISLKAKVSALDEVVVGGNVVPITRRADINATDVITSQQLENSPVQKLDQIFQGLVPGVASPDRGSVSTFNGIGLSIRGSNGIASPTPIKVYIDGIELAAGSTFLENFDKSLIDHIEITRGPSASTLYGSGASSGIIQIFTKKGVDINQLNLQVSGGTIESKYIKGPVFQQVHNISYEGGKKDAFTFNIGGNYSTYGNYIPDADEKDRSIFASAKSVGGPVQIGFTLNYSNVDNGVGTNPILSDNIYPAAVRNIDKVRYTTNDRLLGTDLNFKFAKWWQNTIVLGQDYQEWISKSTLPTVTKTYNYYDYQYNTSSIRYNNAINILPDSSAFKFNIISGLEYKYLLLNTVTATGTSAPIDGSGTYSSVGINRQPQKSTGYFIQLAPSYKNVLFFNAAVRFENNSLFGNNYGTAVSPRIGVTGNFHIGNDLTLKPRITYGKGTTPPQLYYKTGSIGATSVILPNPDIRPQYQQGFDYGLDGFLLNNRLRFNITYYNQKAKDLFVEPSLGKDTLGRALYQYTNLQSAINTGYETELTYHTQHLNFTGTFSIINSKVGDLGANYTGTYVTGQQLVGTTNRTAGLNINYSFFKLFKGDAGGAIAMNLSYMNGVYTYDYLGYYKYAFGHDGDPRGSNLNNYLTTYQPVTKLQLSMNYRLNQKLSCFFQANNLTNSNRPEYQNITPLKGRTMLFGIRSALNFKQQ
ncbi:SusC/RagA family TonB-linked outer membrane protein [Mucilaginibacter sp.]|uniref:TonB-dependent receptor domain-containing protein n=1 Tax=Mucilaginibacter sp. TaxID=1882438 RepID=UPI002616D6C2|nr:SusC/RagA family TonB-linked outer membrane protein [Mucilaginibacter sp.]